MSTQLAEPSITVVGGRRGRKSRAEAPSLPKTIRMSPAEIERLEKAAKLNRQTPQDFARDAVLTATEDVLETVTTTSRR